MKIIPAIRFVALTAAAYCAVATAILVFTPGLYPTKEITDRAQFLVFELAVAAFLAMIICWLLTRARPRS